MGKFGLVNRTKKMWFLTGTPVTNRPIDLYPMVARCMADKFAPNNKYLSFAYRYCGAFQSRFGLVVTGATHLKELNKKLEGFLLRRRKQDVLKELPRRIITHIEFDCTKEVQRIIKEEEDKTREIAGDREPEHFKMGEISRIRRVVAKYKLKDCAGFIEDRLEEDKVVIFFYHKDVRKYLMEKFKKYNPLLIDGSVPAKKRIEIVDKFIAEDKHRIFLGQMEAAGEGIDGLQHASSTCIFVEPDWLPKTMDQCISRLERFGQKNPVNVYILTIKNTIEAKMMKLLEWKLQNINVILNDNQTLKSTKVKEENEMVKDPVKKKLYLEDKIDLLLEGTLLITKKLTVIEEKLNHPMVALDPAAKGGDHTVDTPAEDPPSADESEAVEAITSQEVRKLASKLTEADGVNGKTTCIKIIESVAGKGKKLADCTPDQLKEVANQYMEILNG